MDTIAEQLNSLGLGEMSASLIGLAALSTSFHFIMGFISPILAKIRHVIYNGVVRELEVYVADPDFNKINIWLNENQKHSKFMRTYKIVTSNGKPESGYDDEGETVSNSDNKLVAGYGSVWMFHPVYKLMSISRVKDSNKQVFAQTETLKIRFFSFTDKNIYKFFDEVSSLNDALGPFVFDAPDFATWWRNSGKPKEVYPPVSQTAKDFINDVESFLGKKSLYKTRNVPFKRGYLLFGEAGTGKTSIISHVAHKYDLNLYTLTSASISNFAGLSNQIRPNSIIVIEDIDFTVAGKRRDLKRRGKLALAENESVSDSASDDRDSKSQGQEDIMQSFLNVLDGVKAFDGCIVIATTNKDPNSLDAALIRPGRLDRKVYIGPLTHDEQIKHIENFYQCTVDSEDISEQPDRTFAELQYLCSTHMEQVDDLLDSLNGVIAV